MSNTRRSESGEFHQESFCSSTEYETGLRAYEVAKRAQLLPEAEREIVLWLQAESHKPGGLANLVTEFLAFSRGDIGSATMLEMGVHEPGRIFDPVEVRKLREECDRASIDDILLY